MITRSTGAPWPIVVGVLPLIGLLLFGCGTLKEASPAASPDPTGIEDYPMVWFDTPDLDLKSPDGTFVRALVESWYLRMELGSGAYFPGYRQASLKEYLWPDEVWLPRHDPPHTTYVWAAAFPDPDPQNEHDWHTRSAEVGGVAVCIASPGTELARSGMFFTYQRSGKTPPADQHGARPAPSVNVFGGWKALDFIEPTHLRAQRCEQPPLPLPTNVHTSSPRLAGRDR